MSPQTVSLLFSLTSNFLVTFDSKPLYLLSCLRRKFILEVTSRLSLFLPLLSYLKFPFTHSHIHAHVHAHTHTHTPRFKCL